MPLYEYQCDACHHRFELIQRFSDPPAETCPTCGGSVRKLLSSPAVHFKGSGWYVTDYARKGAGGGAAGEGKGEGKGEEKGEAKPAATASSGAASGGDASGSSKPASSSSSGD
jgi:putative FmdB family regulatory protein